MAVRKKKPLKKKTSRKKAKGKKPSTKSKLTKKKIVKKKKVVKKKRVRPSAKPKKRLKKKSVVKKRPRTKAKQASTNKAKPVMQPVSRAPVIKPRSKHKIFKIGIPVRILSGRQVGCIGRVARQDPCLGTFFITLDDYKKDPTYKDVEWGPYFESKVEAVKS